VLNKVWRDQTWILQPAQPSPTTDGPEGYVRDGHDRASPRYLATDDS
jgi:hypothetical protein